MIPLPMGRARPAILFDLDGTLLPMEMRDFGREYFKSLCAAFPELPPERLKKLVFPHPTVAEGIREAIFQI